MILTEKIKVGISFTNIEHYKQYFDNLKIGDKIEITPNKLSTNSHLKVLVKCDICGDERNIEYRYYISSFNNDGYFTCNKCALKKRQKTKLKKYNNAGYHNVDKMKKTNLEKYSFENVFQNENIKDKIKQTNLEKYGFEFTSQTSFVKEKSKETNLEKYGYEHHLKNKEILKKQHDTNIERYGNEFYLKSNVYKNKRTNYLLKNYNLNIIKFDKSIYTIKCNKCNKEYNIENSLMIQRILYKTTICTLCNPINSFTESGKENQLYDFIKLNYDKIIKLNDRHLIKELDIYLPELKLAFEFNGVYWHNELNKSNDYHKEKTELCEEHGIHLIHIYEDDWLYKKEIVKSRILNLLGQTPNKIYARKCEIKEISDNNILIYFLDKNHLQGFIGSQIKIGLFFNEELVSLMTFGSKRKFMKQNNDKNVYEMLRFCNKLNCSVIGGADKLFKYFINTYKPKEVISYADRSWSQGELYKKLGFIFVGKTPPNYYYVIDGIRKHRFGFRKDKLIREGFDSNKSEHEIMLERKIYRIYDSGSLKFIWNNHLAILNQDTVV